jgi:hypothetical protein
MVFARKNLKNLNPIIARYALSDLQPGRQPNTRCLKSVLTFFGKDKILSGFLKPDN